MGIHVLLIILLSFPLVLAQASPPKICAAGTVARTVSALSGYRPASSFCSSRFGTTVRQTRTLKAVATLTITLPMTINVTTTSSVTLTKTTGTRTTTLRLVPRRRFDKDSHDEGHHLVERVNTPSPNHSIRPGIHTPVGGPPSTKTSSSTTSHTPTTSVSDPRATLRSLSQLSAAAANTICSCLVADLTTTIGFTATATRTVTISLHPTSTRKRITAVSLPSNPTFTPACPNGAKVTTTTVVTPVRTCRPTMGANIVPDGDFNNCCVEFFHQAPWYSPHADDMSAVAVFWDHTVSLLIDAFDGTPEDVRYDAFLQQTMTKIDTRPVYTVSVRLMPQGIYPDPAPPAQPGYCYFTTTCGSLQIDRQVYTQANGSSADFYDIVVPGIVQPNENAILKLDFSCDPGFIGMGNANVIIDRVYIVPTLLCT